MKVSEIKSEVTELQRQAAIVAGLEAERDTVLANVEAERAEYLRLKSDAILAGGTVPAMPKALKAAQGRVDEINELLPGLESKVTTATLALFQKCRGVYSQAADRIQAQAETNAASVVPALLEIMRQIGEWEGDEAALALVNAGDFGAELRKVYVQKYCPHGYGGGLKGVARTLQNALAHAATLAESSKPSAELLEALARLNTILEPA